jgi:hypothetical protein
MLAKRFPAAACGFAEPLEKIASRPLDAPVPGRFLNYNSDVRRIADAGPAPVGK